METEMQITKMKLVSFLLFSLTFFSSNLVRSDEPKRDGNWMVAKDEATGVTTRKMDLTLSPKKECKPALRYRLIADGFDLLDENSAIYYLKALGFLEQRQSLELLMKERAQLRKTAEESGKLIESLPPIVWENQTPAELPLDKVKEHLSRTKFQTPILAEAAKRKHFSMDRNIRSVDDPAMYLLPEIQSMRELARAQSLRCRFAIAEGRIEDAFTILGQQFALARHLDQDSFLVSALVGSAIAVIAWEDSLHLLQHPECPNLYWAFASLPTPLIKMENAMDFERQFFFEQVKVMREVDETPRDASYWQAFIEKFEQQVRNLEFPTADGSPDKQGMDRATIDAMITDSHAGAKKYLIEDLGMDRKIVEAYPKTQAVFLAMKRMFEYLRDEGFKWRFVPFATAYASAEYQKMDSDFREMTAKLGPAGDVRGMLLSGFQSMFNVQQRIQVKIAMTQTIESLRDYAGTNEGKLPSSLTDLRLPAPVDPFNGKPIQYELKDGYAVLSTQDFSKVKWQLTMRVRN